MLDLLVEHGGGVGLLRGGRGAADVLRCGRVQLLQTRNLLQTALL